MKIRPHNIIYCIIGIFVPWQYLSTYIIKDRDQITLSRYYAKDNNLKKNQVSFDIYDVIEIGFPKDLNLKLQEEILHGRYGQYRSQEIIFVLKNKKIIAFNTRPYSKKQCQKFLQLFPCKISQQLKKQLHL